jgi:aldose sugar dehydrogenase
MKYVLNRVENSAVILIYVSSRHQNHKMISLMIFLILSLILSFYIVSPPLEFFFLAARASSELINYQEPAINNPAFKVQMISNEIEFPASMAFLGKDDILVLEKNEGTVKRIVNNTMLPDPLLEASILNQSERGMLGIATVQDKGGYYPDKSQIVAKVFLYYTEAEEDDDARNRVYRYGLENNKLVNPELLVDLSGNPGARHNGGALTIGPDNNLYFAIGDVNDGEDQARNQDTDESDGIAGIMRIEQDGTRAGTLGENHPLNLYYAYGIRNSFGIDFDPVNGNLWDTENGDRNNDEINLVEPGFNSGFNQIQGLSLNKNNFDPNNLVDFDGKGKYSDPEFVWNYTVGPTALKFLTSDKYGKEYQNDMFVGDFNHGYLYHFELNRNRTGLELDGTLKDRMANTTYELEDVIFGGGFGPITDIEVGPDGYLYILSLAQSTNDSRQGCEQNVPFSQCIKYSNPVKGTIFKIIPADDYRNK